MNSSKLHPILLILLALIVASSCDKDEEQDVEIFDYPDSGFYGPNILNANDTVFLADTGPDYGDGNYNSMKAVVPNKTSELRVTIEGKRVVVYQNQGWFTNADPYRYDNYTFKAEGQITSDLKIHFCGGGSATIKIYENETEIPTRIKTIILE